MTTTVPIGYDPAEVNRKLIYAATAALALFGLILIGYLCYEVTQSWWVLRRQLPDPGFWSDYFARLGWTGRIMWIVGGAAFVAGLWVLRRLFSRWQADRKRGFPIDEDYQ